MRKLIIDCSPILYSALFSVSTEKRKKGVKPDESGNLPYDYGPEVSFKVFEEISGLRNFFSADEVILAFDNSKGGYWRKNYYNRYKYSRKKQRDDSDINWEQAYKTFDEIRENFKNTSYKVMYVPHTEADDIAFVLSEYFSNQGHNTILHTVDKDFEHNLIHPGVEVFKTRKTQKKSGTYITKTEEELKEMKISHCLVGDKSDGFLHVKAFTNFSKDFLLEYPKFKGKEILLYDKHHEIEKMYDLKHNFQKSAYKHPSFGMKSWRKKNQTIKELLDENPIHKWNYERNKTLCLPSGIPEENKKEIIQHYLDSDTPRNLKKLQKYFTENGMFELIGKLVLF